MERGQYKHRVLDPIRWTIIVAAWVAVTVWLWRIAWYWGALWIVPGWWITMNLVGFATLPMYFVADWFRLAPERKALQDALGDRPDNSN